VRIDRVARLHDYVDSLLRAPAESADSFDESCQQTEEVSPYLFERGEFFDRNPSVPWEQPGFLSNSNVSCICIPSVPPSGFVLILGKLQVTRQKWRGVFALGAKGTGFPFHLHGVHFIAHRVPVAFSIV